MLSNQVTAKAAAVDADGSVGGGSGGRAGRSNTAGNVFAFASTFVLLLAYALRGGAYDIVAFEEYGLLIWWLLAVGFAVGLLPRVRPGRPVLILCGAILAYAAWTAVSLTWTQSSELTMEEIARSLDYLGLVLLLSLAVGRDTWRAAAAGLAFAALAVCVFAVASRLDPAAFPADVVASTFKLDRLSYPFGYWNAVGAWGAMSATIALAWSAHDRSRARRAVALAMVPAALLATYLSYSRAAVLGTALGLAIVLLTSRNRLTVLAHAAVAAAGGAAAILVASAAPQIARGTGDRGAVTVGAVLVGAMALGFATAWITQPRGVDHWRVPRRAARGAFAASLAAALVAAAIVGPGLISSAWHSFTRTTVVASTADPAGRLLTFGGLRYPVWKSALSAFRAHPLDGTGAGTFEFWWNVHANNAQFIRNAHSLWLGNMAELGLPGLLLIVTMAVAAIVVAASVRHRVRRSTSVGVSTAFLAAFIVFLFHASVDWMWESTAITVLALAGVAVVGARLARGRPRLSWSVRTIFVVLAVGAGAVQLPGLLSTIEIRRSQAAEGVQNGNLALAWANAAVDAEPWSASAYAQRGLVLEAAGRYGAAAADLRKAISHEPTNYVHWLDLAALDTERGRFDAALIDYGQAHRLRPDSVAFALAPSVKLR
jgi:hypothetical protein